MPVRTPVQHRQNNVPQPHDKYIRAGFKGREREREKNLSAELIRVGVNHELLPVLADR